mmetsp:Transcript_8240/g.12312  ORF Transcript_8240/g.12312 Transcript_8240/m.12312 type:complete len:559 (-) Transcript_8240:362-2038(-)
MAEVAVTSQEQGESAALVDEKKCEGLGEEDAIPHLLSSQEEGDSNHEADGSKLVENGDLKDKLSEKEEESTDKDDEICIKGIPSGDGDEGAGEDTQYEVVPNPAAEQVDLSGLRGTRAPETIDELLDDKNGEDLNNLAELVPGLRGRSIHSDNGNDREDTPPKETDDLSQDGSVKLDDSKRRSTAKSELQDSTIALYGKSTRLPNEGNTIEPIDSMFVQMESLEEDTENQKIAAPAPLETGSAEDDGDEEDSRAPNRDNSTKSHSSSSSSSHGDANKIENEEQNLGGFEENDEQNSESSASSSDAGVEDDEQKMGSAHLTGLPPNDRAGAFHTTPSSASLSTATQTHEVRMPMYLPTFKPATNCSNASDFIVRCFVARLRSGITVVKHGRSRWCKSRLRILHVHADGRSLSWKPAMGEPSSSKRPPKLDLSICMEVRHAWSPDPLNPMFTGTPILRQKCEAANAHKSFALIFPKRTVDITAVTADQCKVLMEGFSALCFRLHVANLAGRGKKGGEKEGVRGDEDASTTASVTLTNNSNTMSPNGSGGKPSSKKSGLQR